MTDANKQFLDANRFHYETLVKAQYVKHLDGATRSGMLRIIQEEFNPHYHIDLWCGNCVAELIRYCYQLYDDWISKNAPQ